MNILLTGGSGMVGSFITPYLLKDNNRHLDTSDAADEGIGVDHCHLRVLNIKTVYTSLEVDSYIKMTS